jgi:hypothetical protein
MAGYHRFGAPDAKLTGQGQDAASDGQDTSYYPANVLPTNNVKISAGN